MADEASTRDAETAPDPIPACLKVLADQPRVRDFLAAAVRERRLSHAYLFCGAPGSGQERAALELAKCVVCPTGGCGTCDECIRVAHRTHPDVHWLAPEGASGYVVEQVRSLIEDVALTPVRATGKVYVLERADTLRESSANALLKTLEEPPEGVVFILIARSVDSVLPTIASRCQCVPFRVVDPESAARRVAERCGIDGQRARIALAVAGTPERAVEYLGSRERQEARAAMVRALDELANDDAWDVLRAAEDIVEKAKAPEEAAATGEDEEYLSPRALRLIEQRAKRNLTARGRSSMIEVLAAADSVLRDVLVRVEGVGEPIVNADMADVVERLGAAASSEGVLAALAAVSVAADDLAHNVSPRLALEVMLCSCKEALCPPSSR